MNREQEIPFFDIEDKPQTATAEQMIDRLEKAVCFIGHSSDSLATDENWGYIDGAKKHSLIHLLEDAAVLIINAQGFLRGAFPEDPEND